MATKAPSKTKATAKKAAAKPRLKIVKEPNQCTCFAISDDDGATFHSCGRTTARSFAPGHDAKLKGVLIRLAAAGSPYVVIDGGTRTEYDPQTVANERGWGENVAKAVTRERKLQEATEARKAQAAQRKAEAAEAKANKPTKAAAKDKPAAGAKAGFNPVQVRIGRVVYDASIESESPKGVVVKYKDRSGASKTATVKRSAIVA